MAARINTGRVTAIAETVRSQRASPLRSRVSDPSSCFPCGRPDGVLGDLSSIVPSIPSMKPEWIVVCSIRKRQLERIVRYISPYPSSLEPQFSPRGLTSSQSRRVAAYSAWSYSIIVGRGQSSRNHHPSKCYVFVQKSVDVVSKGDRLKSTIMKT